MSWSPCGQFLAVGSYDQMLRVLNHLTWKTFAEFMHLSNVRGPCCTAVFKVIDCHCFMASCYLLLCFAHIIKIHFRLLNFQEVDEPLPLDMSELCLTNDFMQGNNGKPDCLYN